eukprot:1223053-Amphidinium_carterae.1
MDCAPAECCLKCSCAKIRTATSGSEVRNTEEEQSGEALPSRACPQRLLHAWCVHNRYPEHSGAAEPKFNAKAEDLCGQMAAIGRSKPRDAQGL